MTVDEWTREVNNNVLSAFLVTREAFPHMAKTGGGSVINFARAGNAQANMLPYNVAKAGVVALTRTFALEGKEAKIRVNAVAPGLVDTASNVAMMKPKDTSKWAKRDEIADVVVFLASPAVAGRDGSGLDVTGWGCAVPSTVSAGRQMRMPSGVTTIGRSIRFGCCSMASRSCSSLHT